MKRSLVGQIFHFKPREKGPDGALLPEVPEEPTEPPWGQKKGGRRSNRLFALHPVVVIKDLRPGVIEDQKNKAKLDQIKNTEKEKVNILKNQYATGGDLDDADLARDDSFGWDSASWLEELPDYSAMDFSTPPTTPESSPLSTPSSSRPSTPTFTPSSTPASTPASSPISDLISKRDMHSAARRPSLERRDAEANLKKEKVVIVNITSQIHDYVDTRNYLPIAAPGREYQADYMKRVFLAPGESPEISPETSPDGYDSDSWDTSSQWSSGTVDTEYSLSPSESDAPKKVKKAPPYGINYLSNADRPQSPPECGEVSSDEIWRQQVPYIDDLTPDTVCLPRPDSFVRLDSRTTIAAEELEPFRRPTGGSYQIHPESLDLLWQCVIECERGFRDPGASVLHDIESAAEKAVANVMKDQAAKEVERLRWKALDEFMQWQFPKKRLAPPGFIDKLNKSEHAYEYAREQELLVSQRRQDNEHFEKVLQGFSDDVLNLMQDFREREKKWLRETYSTLHTKLVLRPTQEEKPFHPDQYLGKMLKQNREEKERGDGEGEASLNKPIKSTLALKAIMEGKPLPNKREKARAPKTSVKMRPHRASSNPEDVRPHQKASPTHVNHPLASKHSKSSAAIAAQSERPKATFHNEAPAKPRIQDKNWAQAGNWREWPTSDTKSTSARGRRNSEVTKKNDVSSVHQKKPNKGTGPAPSSKKLELAHTEIKTQPGPAPYKAFAAPIPTNKTVESVQISMHSRPMHEAKHYNAASVPIRQQLSKGTPAPAGAPKSTLSMASGPADNVLGMNCNAQPQYQQEMQVVTPIKSGGYANKENTSFRRPVHDEVPKLHPGSPQQRAPFTEGDPQLAKMSQRVDMAGSG